MRLNKFVVLAVAAATALFSAANAATFSFTGEITSVTPIEGWTNPPSIGEEVSFQIFINDAAPNRGVFDEDPAGVDSLLPVISVTTAGGLGATVAELQISGTPQFTTTGYSFSTVGSGISGVEGISTFGANLHSASFSFDAFSFADISNPTVRELVAALTASSVVSGSFNAGTQDSNTLAFGGFSAAFTTLEVSDVPLPGAIIFFTTGFAGLILKRKTKIAETK